MTALRVAQHHLFCKASQACRNSVAMEEALVPSAENFGKFHRVILLRQKICLIQPSSLSLAKDGPWLPRHGHVAIDGVPGNNEPD